MAETKKPLLDLLSDREFVRIDGEPYELRNADELSALELQQIGSWGRQLDRLITADDLDEDDQALLDKLPDRICRKVLLAPDEVHEKLTDGQRLAIAQAFTRLQVQKILERAGAMEFVERVREVMAGIVMAHQEGEGLDEAIAKAAPLLDMSPDLPTGKRSRPN